MEKYKYYFIKHLETLEIGSIWKDYGMIIRVHIFNYVYVIFSMLRILFSLTFKCLYRWTSLFAVSVSAVSLIRDWVFVTKPHYSRDFLSFTSLIREFVKIYFKILKIFVKNKNEITKISQKTFLFGTFTIFLIKQLI